MRVDVPGIHRDIEKRLNPYVVFRASCTLQASYGEPSR